MVADFVPFLAAFAEAYQMQSWASACSYPSASAYLSTVLIIATVCSASIESYLLASTFTGASFCPTDVLEADCRPAPQVASS